jgi:hypothetical protein
MNRCSCWSRLTNLTRRDRFRNENCVKPFLLKFWENSHGERFTSSTQPANSRIGTELQVLKRRAVADSEGFASGFAGRCATTYRSVFHPFISIDGSSRAHQQGGNRIQEEGSQWLRRGRLGSFFGTAISLFARRSKNGFMTRSRGQVSQMALRQSSFPDHETDARDSRFSSARGHESHSCGKG